VRLNAIDPKLLDYARTERQAQLLRALLEHGTLLKAAKAIGCARNNITQARDAVIKHAALKGYAPQADMVHPTVAPFIVKGVSTYYDADGAVRGQWVKTKVDREQAEAAVREAINALMLDTPRAKATPSPTAALPELCNLYTITDYHVGMRAWAPETGADWDLKIAEDTLIAAFQSAVTRSPPADTALVSQLGDFLHFDALAPMTPTSGHILDADGRYSHVVRTATRLLRVVIDTALRHHKKVVVLMAEGNHDIASSVWLRHVFSLLYENEPRVQVVDGETPFYAHRHGDVMLAFHHGHMVKNAQLPLLFAARYPEVWGQTKKRYCHVGHWHHVDEKEHAGMKVIQHATLAAADAYAARHGYLSQREISAITYHRKWGQVARTTVCPEMLR